MYINEDMCAAALIVGVVVCELIIVLCGAI